MGENRSGDCRVQALRPEIVVCEVSAVELSVFRVLLSKTGTEEPRDNATKNCLFVLETWDEYCSEEMRNLVF